MNRPRLIFGLANPGPVYENTRHNLGARAVLYLAELYNLHLKVQRSLGSAVAHYPGSSGDIFFARSLGFMNLSGDPLSCLVKEYGVARDDILVVHDDARLFLGSGAWQKGGPVRGQNGLRHIITRLGWDEFWRLRLGVANEFCHPGIPGYQERVGAHVLGKFTKEENFTLEEFLRLSAQQMQLWIKQEPQNDFNGENFCLPPQPALR